MTAATTFSPVPEANEISERSSVPEAFPYVSHPTGSPHLCTKPEEELEMVNIFLEVWRNDVEGILVFVT